MNEQRAIARRTSRQQMTPLSSSRISALNHYYSHSQMFEIYCWVFAAISSSHSQSWVACLTTTKTLPRMVQSV